MEELHPIARIEYFLNAILNGDPAPFEPQARAEYYLAYLCGADVVLPEPQSRVDFYLAYKCGEDVEIPDPIERIDFFLAKWCGEAVETPDPIHPIEYYLNALANSGELKTVTGNPISISDALAKPAEALTIEILPYQSGSGDPSPDNVRPISGFTGVNIYHESAYDPDADPTYAIDWTDEAGTVYGGSLDVTTGVLTVTHGYLSLNTATMNNNTDYPGWKSSGVRDIVGAGKNGRLNNVILNCGTAVNANTTSSQDTLFLPKSVYNMTQSEWKALALDCQFVLPLATPITYQLTPTEIQILLGNNTIWNDVNGDMTLEYLADGPADDVDALQILLNNRYVNNGEPDEATDKEALEILLGGNTR